MSIFVYKGSGYYEIQNEILELEKGDFIRIPYNTPHKLSVKVYHKPLELIYLGIVTD